MKKTIMLTVLMMLTGCSVRHHQSHIEGMDASGVPGTQNRYWIRVCPGVTLASQSTWGQCLAVYERRLPSVFSPRGLPVYVEIVCAECSTPTALTVVSGIIWGCTLTIIPGLKEDVHCVNEISVSLDENFKTVETFRTVCRKRGYMGLLAPLFPMPDVQDNRFLHKSVKVGDDYYIRPEYAQTNPADDYSKEAFCSDADAIVQGVACALQKLERSRSANNRPKMIGD